MTTVRRSGRQAKAAVEKAEKGPAWIKWVVGSVIAFAVVLLIINLTGGGSAYKEETATNVLSRARTLMQEGNYKGAADACALALLRNPDDATKAAIEETKKEVQLKLDREVDRPTLEMAERTIKPIREFQTQFPPATRTRAQTRELARMAQEWLKRCLDAAKKYPDTAALALEVQTLLDSIAPAAQLSLPDDGGDVMFAIERKLSGKAPNYREMLRQIDDFISTHPKDLQLAELKKRRTQLESEAVAAFDRAEADARRFLAAGMVEETNRALEAARNAIVMDAMAIRANNLEREVRNKRK